MIEVLAQKYRQVESTIRNGIMLCLVAWLAACASTQTALPTLSESLPDAITVPYQISPAGHFVIDIAVNGQPPQPVVIDTGATVSALYERNASALGLAPNGQSVFVRGLVETGQRPIVRDVEIEIGTKAFQLDRIAVLETPATIDETIGLLGADVLSDYAIVFNKDALTATFVPSKHVKPSHFVGWRKIPLHSQFGAFPDIGLHFAQATLKKKKVPVLIDTGSNLNIVNWPLATLDRDMRRLHRRLREATQLQGALGSSLLKVETVFFDLVLGQHYWPTIDIIITELDTLATIAAVDEPLMISGAGMFTARTIAFDFGGDMIYLLAEPDDLRPPSSKRALEQSRFGPQSINDQAS